MKNLLSILGSLILFLAGAALTSSRESESDNLVADLKNISQVKLAAGTNCTDCVSIKN